MSKSNSTPGHINLSQIVDVILATIDQEREREIISRRFGLFNRKETLEQIGDYLGITRERVRQLEKAITIRLKISSEEGQIPEMTQAEKIIIRNLIELGRVAKLSSLTDYLLDEKSTEIDQSRLAFIAEISSQLTVVDENDNYHQAICIAEYGDKKTIRKEIDHIVKTIRQFKKPVTLEELDEQLNYQHPDHIQALALISKKLATLNGLWGLNRWPEVNPKNIKDKIYVVLKQANKPMHFSDIDKTIKESDFKRKNVTKQAIHNELIKDDRFVLIGRGIYALKEWGYESGTVAEIIARILKSSPEPMFRDEIVKRVLKKRRVKETTILLNLQSRPEFKRVAKATYTYQAIPKENA